MIPGSQGVGSRVGLACMANSMAAVVVTIKIPMFKTAIGLPTIASDFPALSGEVFFDPSVACAPRCNTAYLS